MPTSFRKSLTAWEQLAALPPTPRKNSRPPLARASARIPAIRSMAEWSSLRLISCTWSRVLRHKVGLVIHASKFIPIL